MFLFIFLKYNTEHFLFHRHTTLGCQVSCRYPRTHAVWGVIFHRRNLTPTPSSLAYCNRYRLSQNTSVLPLPASPLSDRFSHPPLYILFCVASLSELLFLFFTLHFLPHLIFCLLTHLLPSCTAAEDIFSVHHYLWSLRSALLHRKTLQWNIHVLNLL